MAGAKAVARAITLAMALAASTAMAGAVPLGAGTATAAPQATITGVVRLVDGTPVGGATVEQLGGSLVPATTDGTGAYSLAVDLGSPGAVTVQAVPPGSSTYVSGAGSERSVTVAAGATATADLTLLQGYVVTVEYRAPGGAANTQLATFPVACSWDQLPDVTTFPPCHPADPALVSTPNAFAQVPMRILTNLPSRSDVLLPAGAVSLAGYRLTGGGIIPAEQSSAAPLVVTPGRTMSCTVELSGGPAACTATGSASTADVDGVPAAVEDPAPNGGDGNSDGIADRTQANVASEPSTSFVSAPGTSFVSAHRFDALAGFPPRPAGVTLTGAGFEFALGGVEAGAGIDVEILTPLSGASSVNTYLRRDGFTWSNVAGTTARFTRRGVVLHLVDGGAGDDDHSANGGIVHTGFFAHDASLPAVSFEEYTAITPARLLDTRTDAGLSTIDGTYLALRLQPAGSTIELQVTGRAGVPADASAAVLNIAVTDPQAPGFITVYPCGTTRPTAANLNHTTGQTIPNGVIAGIGTGGKVCIYTYAATHLVADLDGYVPAS